MSVLRNFAILLIPVFLFANAEEIANQQNKVLKEKREYSPNSGNTNGFHYEKNAKTINTQPVSNNVQPQNAGSTTLMSQQNLQNLLGGYELYSGGQYSNGPFSGGQFSSGQYSTGQSPSTHLQPIYVMGDLNSLSHGGQNLDLSSLFNGQAHIQGTSLQNVGPVIFTATPTALGQQPNHNYGPNIQSLPHYQVPATSYGIPSQSVKLPANHSPFNKPLFSPNLFQGPSNYAPYLQANSVSDSQFNNLKTESNTYNTPAGSNDESVSYFGGHLLQNPLSSGNSFNYNSLISNSPSALFSSSMPHLQMALTSIPSYSAAPAYEIASQGPSYSFESSGGQNSAYSHIPSQGPSHSYASPASPNSAYSHISGPNIVFSGHQSSGDQTLHMHYMKLDQKLASSFGGIGHAKPASTRQYPRQSSEESSKIYDTIKYSEPMGGTGYLPK